MDIFLAFLFPSILFIGTFLLGYKEIKYYITHKTTNREPAWARSRLIRRFTGLGIMICISIMIFVGVNLFPSSKPSIDYIRFWLVCFFLVIIVLFIALWDAISEIRKIKDYVDEFHNTEVKNLKEKFKIYYN